MPALTTNVDRNDKELVTSSVAKSAKLECNLICILAEIKASAVAGEDNDMDRQLARRQSIMVNGMYPTEYSVCNKPYRKPNGLF